MSDIVDKIAKVAKFADPKHPSYGSVQFTAGSVRATGPEGGASTPTGLDIEAVVASQSLLKACKALPDAELSMGATKTGEPRLRLQQGTSRAHLELLPPKQVATVARPPASAQWVTIEGLDQLDRVAWCTSADSTRPQLHGVHLTSGWLEATDGSAAVRLAVAGDINAVLPDGGCLPVHMLKGLPSPVQMTAVDRQVFFTADPKSEDYRVVSLYDAAFPPLDAIFQRSFELPALSVQRKEMLEILKSARLADINVVLEVQGSGLRVKVDHVGNNQSLSLFDFESFVEFTGEVPEGISGFAVGLLQPAVQYAKSNELTVHLKPNPQGTFDPLGISDSNYQAVVMPIRL